MEIKIAYHRRTNKETLPTGGNRNGKVGALLKEDHMYANKKAFLLRSKFFTDTDQVCGNVYQCI